MPWATIDAVPASLKGAGLKLSQAQEWGRHYDMARATGADEGDAAARAWLTFKKRHRKSGSGWTMKRTDKTEAMGARFLESYDVQNPRRLRSNPQAGRLTPENRAYHIERQLPAGSTVLAVYEGHALADDAEAGLRFLTYGGTGQALRVGQSVVPLGEQDAIELLEEFANHEHGRFGSLLMEVGKRNSAADEKRIADLVNLGLDLLGPDSAKSCLTARRSITRKAQPNKAPIGANESVHVSGAVSKSKTASANYTSVTRTGGAGGNSGPAHFSLTPRDGAQASESARRALLGDGAIEITVLDENRTEEVQDSFFALANELDQIATTRLVMNVSETIATLNRAKEALASVRIVKYVDNPDRPGEPNEVTISPEDFWAYGIEDLARRLEGNATIQDWLMVEERSCREIGKAADNLRRWVHAQRFPRVLPESVGDATRDVMDLFATEIQEGRDPRPAIRRRMASLMEAATKGKKCGDCGAMMARGAKTCSECGHEMAEGKLPPQFAKQGAEAAGKKAKRKVRDLMAEKPT